MQREIRRMKDTMLGRISCTTTCTHLDPAVDEHCHEQGCVLHFRPFRTRSGKETICATKISVESMYLQAEGAVKYALHPHAEKEGNMLPTEFYDKMDVKYRFRKRKKGNSFVDVAHVCHQHTCHTMPPPTLIMAGNTIFFTIVSLHEDGTYKMLPSGAFRLVLYGSQTGRSCVNGPIRRLGDIVDPGL